jgi:hypothetical protein
MSSNPSTLLRNVLRADAVVCAIGGVDLVAFSSPIASLLGMSEATPLPVIGVVLAVYGVYLWIASRRDPLSLNEAWAFAMGDLVWVAASAALIAFGPLSANGNWIVGIVALVTLAVAELKLLGIRRIRRAQPRLALRHEAA